LTWFFPFATCPGESRTYHLFRECRGRDKMRALIAVVLMGMSPAVPAAEGAGLLQVSFSNLKPGSGELVVSLFRNGKHWLDGERAYRRQVVQFEGGSATASFAGLEYADYGLYAFHDENANRKFDMRWLPWPKPVEGAGVSNNALRNGPPRYEDARFRFDRDGMQLEIAFKYY
jgi:uncharacterized protein (DUF2141 family)